MSQYREQALQTVAVEFFGGDIEELRRTCNQALPTDGTSRTMPRKLVALQEQLLEVQAAVRASTEVPPEFRGFHETDAVYDGALEVEFCKQHNLETGASGRAYRIIRYLIERCVHAAAERDKLKRLAPRWQVQSKGVTHYAGCYLDHRDCALRHLDDLQAQVNKLKRHAARDQAEPTDVDDEECELCSGAGEILSVEHGDIPCPSCVSRQLHKQLRACQ